MQDKHCIEIEITEAVSNYDVSVAAAPKLASCKILVASYKDGRMISVQSKDYSDEEITFDFEGDFDEFRVFAWDDMESFEPLCEAEVIPESEWISQ